MQARQAGGRHREAAAAAGGSQERRQRRAAAHLGVQRGGELVLPGVLRLLTACLESAATAKRVR